MIEMLFHHYYLICQIAFTCFLIWMGNEEGWNNVKDKINKENVIIVGLLILSGPIGVFAMLTVIFYSEYKSRCRKLCNAAITKWEKRARLRNGSALFSWDWYHSDNKKKEERYNALRECIDCLSDKELNLLVSVDEETYKLEPALRDALMDEMFHRKIVSHE